MPARTLLVAALLALAAVAPAAAALPARPLPLGPQGLQERRDARVAAPGVEYTRITRGEAPEGARWVVDVAFVATRAEARAAAARVRAAGADARTEAVAGSAVDDAPGRAGLLVRTGAFATEAEALAAPGDGDVLCVAHGHVLRILAARWLGLGPEAGAHLALVTGAVCVLGFERDTRVLWRWNDTAR